MARTDVSDLAFPQWLARVNAVINRMVGLQLDDLADVDTRSAFEDGASPAAFAREVLADEGYEGE